MMRMLALSLLAAFGSAMFSLEEIQACMSKSCAVNEDVCCTHYYDPIMAANTMNELTVTFYQLSAEERSDILACAQKYISHCN